MAWRQWGGGFCMRFEMLKIIFTTRHKYCDAPFVEIELWTSSFYIKFYSGCCLWHDTGYCFLFPDGNVNVIKIAIGKVLTDRLWGFWGWRSYSLVGKYVHIIVYSLCRTPKTTIVLRRWLLPTHLPAPTQCPAMAVEAVTEDLVMRWSPSSIWIWRLPKWEPCWPDKRSTIHDENQWTSARNTPSFKICKCEKQCAHPHLSRLPVIPRLKLMSLKGPSTFYSLFWTPSAT